MPKSKSIPAPITQQSQPAEIYLYGEIGESWWADESITGKTIADQLALIPPNTPIHLRINSPGGDVSEGLAIYNLLRQRSEVTAYIDGYACSAASFIALAADTVISPESSIWMIHPASGMCYGTASDMRSTAEILDVHTEAVLGIYSDRTGKSREEIAALLEAETWFTGKEAYEMGFATQTTSEPIRVEQVLPRFFERCQNSARLQELGWRIGTPRPRVAASANTTKILPTPPQEIPRTMDENINANSERITQMADQIRDLKLQLQTATTGRQESEAELTKQKIVNQYWQLRATALNLFAVENKLTEEDFRIDFSEDPAIDIDNLTSMSAEDARFDLGMKDRMLRRASAKKPIERVTSESGKAMLNNTSIKSMAVDLQQGEVAPVEAKPIAKTPTGEPVEDFAQRIVAGLKIK